MNNNFNVSLISMLFSFRKESEMEQSHKMTTKVKARVTRTNRGNLDDFEAATPVKLPTGVLRLNEDKLPQFSFNTPTVSKLPATSTPNIDLPTVDKKNIAESKSKHETVTNSVFKFSNPVKVSNDTPQACASPPKYTFESPERRIDQKFESKSDDCSVVVGKVKEPETISTKTKDWACADCWVKNKAEATKCVCCGSKPPMPNAKCSVCKLADSLSQKDKCANCEKMSVSSQVASPIKTNSTGISSSSKWKCEVCWVSNEDSAAKCVCCSGSRPRSSSTLAIGTTTSLTSTITSQTSTVFKPVPKKAVPTESTVNADWKCDDCWISNKSSVDKCAACGGARPGAKQTSVADTTPNSFFGTNKLKLMNEHKKWECNSCLVRNESDRHTCICCGAEKVDKKKMTDIKFNFGKIANSSFKFGIDSKVQEAAISKKPEVNVSLESKSKTQSETNNNILAETPTFTFALPKKTVENKSDDSKGKSVEAPKMNFTFGIPKQTSTSTVVTNKLDSNKDLEEEKVQEVPSVDLNAPTQSKPLIMAPPSQVNSENKTLTSGTLFNPQPATDVKKDTPVNSVDSPASSAEKPKTTPTFTFGMSSNTKLFETKANTSPSMNLFTQQSQSTALPTTSAPSFSMFKSPETSTATATLFQQPIGTTTSAPMFQTSESNNNATSAPLFSFGNNGPSNPTPPSAALTMPAAPEKPKFPFTFGTNSTTTKDSPALFQSPFGVTESSSTNTSTFSLSTGTTLGANNNLPTTLGGSNGLVVSNGLTGNAMAVNSLGSMAGSSLSSSTITIGNIGTLGGTNGLSTNPLPTASSMQPANSLTAPAPSLFNNTGQKDNVWSASSSTSTPNPFVSNSASSTLQKPTFTFGSSAPFNAASSTPTFGTSATPQNVFGMNNQTNNTQSSLFANTVPTQPTGNLFGSPQPASNPTPQMPMFGASTIGATPTFGSANPSIPSFEAPAPAPAFNFGAPQSTGIFGFGQQVNMFLFL